MTLLGPTLQAFFTERMASQFGASPHTVTAYRDTWRLLLTYLADATGTPPQNLDLAVVTAEQVNGFLTHLEVVRGNAVSTRNARLAAIHAFFGYAAYRHPEHATTIGQVMAIPAKRHHRTDLTYLTPPEVTALLAAPDQTTHAGRRDHALLQVAVTAGLRVSELTALRLEDLHLGAAAHVVCRGKGRKNVTPLDAPTVAVLRAYTAGLPAGTDIVFPTRTRDPHEPRRRRGPPHRARRRRQHHLPHPGRQTDHSVLRHSAAMRLLAAGIDSTVIALWLGHESIDTTRIYLHADMKIKQRAMDRTAPTGTQPGRYVATHDKLLAFLQSL